MVFHLYFLCNCCWLGGKQWSCDAVETLHFSALQGLGNAQALLFLKSSALLLGSNSLSGKTFQKLSP